MRLIAFALLAVAIVSGKEKICEPGTLSKMECNDCICSADGSFRSCTLMACDDDHQPGHEATSANPEKIDNEITTISEKSASEATSVKSVQADEPISTVSPVPQIPNVRSRQYSDEPCEAGESFKHFCNSCTCGSDGRSAICTKMECVPGMFDKHGTQLRMA